MKFINFILTEIKNLEFNKILLSKQSANYSDFKQTHMHKKTIENKPMAQTND